VQDQVTGNLLGDGTGARFDPAREDVLDKRAANRNRVPARVIKVALVLGRDNSMHYKRRYIAQGDLLARAALLAGQFDNQIAFSVENARRLKLWLVVGQRGDFFLIRRGQTGVIDDAADDATRAQQEQQRQPDHAGDQRLPQRRLTPAFHHLLVKRRGLRNVVARRGFFGGGRWPRPRHADRASGSIADGRHRHGSAGKRADRNGTFGVGLLRHAHVRWR